jgi:hypothetical protein
MVLPERLLSYLVGQKLKVTELKPVQTEYDIRREYSIGQVNGSVTASRNG